MQNKVKFILGILVFVLFISAAVFAYEGLRKRYGAQSNLAPANKNNAKENSVDDNAANDSTDKRTDDVNNTTDDTANTSNVSDDEMMTAPDFVVEDFEGNAVKLSELFGKPIVINFWASWCPPCKAEMPDFNNVYLEMGEDITFMMIDLVDGQRETKEKGAEYISEQGFSFPVYYDVNQEASYTYGIASIPTTIFVDKDGYIITGAQGAIDEETLRRGIDLIK